MVSRELMAFISSSVREKSNTSPFWRMPVGVHRFGQGEEAVLQAPADADLGRRLAVFIADLDKQGDAASVCPASWDSKPR